MCVCVLLLFVQVYSLIFIVVLQGIPGKWHSYNYLTTPWQNKVPALNLYTYNNSTPRVAMATVQPLQTLTPVNPAPFTMSPPEYSRFKKFRVKK